MACLRILTFSSLFPNPALPFHGVFVAERLRHLLASGEVESRVIAPVPWFPANHPLFGLYARFAQIPRSSYWQGTSVLHPRHFVIPGPGWYATPHLMAFALRDALRTVQREGWDFQAIDAHYYYPDGVAAALLGRWIGRPVVITARGTDVNLIPRHPLARRMILWAERHSAASIAVSQALKNLMVGFGIPGERITVLRNGVDTQRFRPIDRLAARRRIQIEGKVLLSVGNLIELKGHHLVIEALGALPGWTLVVIGDGEHGSQLRAKARAAGCADRVRFLGRMPQNDLVDHYNAADALVLASSREGLPNVVLEAMACGTPVVATCVGGTPEVMREPETGRLVRERTAEALVAAIRDLEAHPPDRGLIRKHAEAFAWDETTRGQVALFRRVIEERLTGEIGSRRSS